MKIVYLSYLFIISLSGRLLPLVRVFEKNIIFETFTKASYIWCFQALLNIPPKGGGGAVPRPGDYCVFINYTITGTKLQNYFAGVDQESDFRLSRRMKSLRNCQVDTLR